MGVREVSRRPLQLPVAGRAANSMMGVQQLPYGCNIFVCVSKDRCV